MSSVLHLITTIKRGGAENQLLVLVREQVNAGLNVHVAYLKDDPELEQDFQEAGSTVHHELSGLKLYKQPLRLRKLLRNREFIVHAHLPRAELVGFLTFSKFKFITSRHNAEPFFPNAPKVISNLLSRMVTLRARKVIAISSAVKKFLVETGEIKSIDKIEVVLYGYQPHFNPASVKKKPVNRVLRIGTISRLSEQKDIPTMLRAFQQFQESQPGATLSILGAGPLEGKLRNLAHQMNLENSVTFLGRSSKIYDFLESLDVFILTSKYEGFGMVLLEAMDAGIPIVAPRNSAIPEVLGEYFPGLSDTGISSDFSSKLNLMIDPQFRKNVLAIQEERLRMFASSKMSRKIQGIYFN